MNQNLLDQIKSTAEVAEGRTSWLYRDSAAKGNATCGIGHLVPDFAHAQALPFHPPIQWAEWLALMSAPAGCRASFYQIDTKGRLEDEDVDNLLDADLNEAIGQLELIFPEWDSYGDGPKLALLDMMFNMGPITFNQFHRLIAAAKARDWKTAELQCHRVGISAERNAWTAAQFALG